MALVISIDTEFGVSASYWHIGAVQEDFRGKATEVTLYGYSTAEARRGGKQPLSAGKIQLSGDDYVAGADREQLYEIIKQRPEFAEAIDSK